MKRQSDKICIIYDKSDNTLTFAAAEMKKLITSIGYSVRLVDLEHGPLVFEEKRIVLTTRETKESKESKDFLSLPATLPLPPSEGQGYSIRKKVHEKYTEWYVIGFDKSGALIGGIEFGNSVRLDGFDAVCDCDKKPYIKARGIKYNIPLDARTPSYSDAGDSAQANIKNVWDMSFWHQFLDEMARNHFNVLSLWNLHPFPSMVKVPSYPKAALNDVKKTRTLLTPDSHGVNMSTPISLENMDTLKVITIDEKIKFWQDVMQYAKDRCIDIFIVTWNIFVYGTEQSGYGFTTDVRDVNTQDYFRQSVKALIHTYPLLKGIGITAGENMSLNADLDEAWLYNTYGRGINDALAEDGKRTFRLIHRIQFANIKKAIDAFSGLNSRCILDTSFKYSIAHVYSSVKPEYIHSNNDAYLKDIGTHKTWLTVRDDDYYMFRGGCDSEFIRAYIKNIPYEKMEGFYIGSDGYNWGREYNSKGQEGFNPLIMVKRWYSFMLWGRLAYDPDIPKEEFVKTISMYFPDINGRNLYEAWSKASQIIPLVNRIHNGECQADYQWYPEACIGRSGFHDIDRFIKSTPQSGEGIVGIREYADLITRNADIKGITPVEISKNLSNLAEEVLCLIKELRPKDNRELRQTLDDIDALAALGMYYSKKILGATNKCISDFTSRYQDKIKYKEYAKENLIAASGYWRAYAQKVDKLYIPQTLSRLISAEKVSFGLDRNIDVVQLQESVDKEILL
jgi:hypothetical protein